MDDLPPVSRNSDYETSKAAERMINAVRPSLMVQMLRAYLYEDRTDEEAATRMDLLHVGYWKRASDLRNLHLIEPTGDTRKATSGNQQIVCRITDEGRRILRERTLANRRRDT